MKKHIVEFIINSSHETDKIGYNSRSEYKIIDEGVVKSQYISELIVDSDVSDDVIRNEFELEAKVASVGLAKNEKNQSNSCPFFTIDWKTYKEEPVKNMDKEHETQNLLLSDFIQIKDYLSIKLTRNIELKDIHEFIHCKKNYSFDVELFYHGLMANNAKSKFFHFFTIIELLEGSGDFRKQFDGDLLFSTEEINDIKYFGDKFHDRKKKHIHKILNITKMNREEKLFLYLQGLNLECINSKQIVIKDIENIISQRNKLYHGSKFFDSNIVYGKLFPLVREIIIKRLTSRI